MLKLKTTTRFEKDYRKAIKSGKDMTRLKRVMTWIAGEQALPTELRDHKLIGNYQGRRECHLSGDWLLIYKLEDDTRDCRGRRRRCRAHTRTLFLPS
ncbi:MAG: type II toxin-antitoxin system YafQ family toxin [Lentisphaerae bacterium]|jgi:mRNA interferase YafQ|nr:type II toxin-antitoxin system YafQ family toxin [Lentisphaerota bacterium]